MKRRLLAGTVAASAVSLAVVTTTLVGSGYTSNRHQSSRVAQEFTAASVYRSAEQPPGQSASPRLQVGALPDGFRPISDTPAAGIHTGGVLSSGPANADGGHTWSAQKTEPAQSFMFGFVEIPVGDDTDPAVAFADASRARIVITASRVQEGVAVPDMPLVASRERYSSVRTSGGYVLQMMATGIRASDAKTIFASVAIQ